MTCPTGPTVLVGGATPGRNDRFKAIRVHLQGRVADLAMRQLVTLTGAGGVGKTRTALEMCWLASAAFTDGVWSVNVAPITESAAVAVAVAMMMSIRPQPAMTAADAVVSWLRGRCLLSVTDNCEPLLDAVVELVGAIVLGRPTVTVLATSREPLGGRR